MTDRRVRIAFSDDYATFTQRGYDPTVGFIRRNGRTISGYVWQSDVNERVFSPAGINEDFAYERVF